MPNKATITKNGPLQRSDPSQGRTLPEVGPYPRSNLDHERQMLLQSHFWRAQGTLQYLLNISIGFFLDQRFNNLAEHHLCHG